MLDEAFGVDDIGGVEDLLALGDDDRGAAVMKGGRGEEADAGMVVLFVVPVKEWLAEGPGVLERTKAIGETRPVLQSAKLAFGIGVVVGDVGAAVGLGDAEVAEEEGHGFGGHGGAIIGVDLQLAGPDLLLAAGSFEQRFGELSAFAMGDHPANDITAEDVEDDI